MNKKIAILGDLHIGARNDSLVFSNHIKRFFDQVFFPYLKENDINFIIQVGDIFDRRKYINFRTLYDARKYFFDKARSKNIQIYTIPGNHDIFYKDTLEINSLELLLQEYNNIGIFTEPEQIDFWGTKFQFIPWICASNEQQCLNVVANSTADFCIGHLQLVGYEMRRGTVADHGLDAKLFNKFETVFTGHFHHMSLIGNIYYIGTPYEIDWSDFDDTKGFHIFDCETRTSEFIKNPFSLYHKIYYDEKDYHIDTIKQQDFSMYKNTYVKVIVKNKKNGFLFDLFIEQLEQAEVHDMQIIEESLLVQFEEFGHEIDQTEDTLTMVSKFVDQLETDVDKNGLKLFFNNLYTEAHNRE